LLDLTRHRRSGFLVLAGLVVISIIAFALGRLVPHVSGTAAWLYLLVVLPVTLRWGRAAGRAVTLVSAVLALMLASRPLLRPYSGDAADLTRVLIAVCGTALVVEVVDRINRVRIAGERQSAVDARNATAAAIRDTVVGRLAEGLVLADTGGRIIWINEMAQQLYGSVELGAPLDKQSGYEVLTVDGRPYSSEDLPLRRALEHDETVTNVETEVLRRDGVRLVLQGSAAPLAMPNGTKVGAVLVARDVTTERELQRQKDDLLERERAARAEAEAAVHQIRTIQAISDTALAVLHLDALVSELLDEIRGALAADEATILLLTDDGQHLMVNTIVGVEREVVRDVRVPVGEGFAGRVAATRAPVIVDDLSMIQVVNPYLRENIRSLAGVPLLVEGRAIGVLHVGTIARHHFTDSDVRLLQLVADRVALAVDRARLHEAERNAGVEAMAARTRLSAVLRHLPVGVLIADASSGRIVMANDQVAEILRRPAGDPDAPAGFDGLECYQANGMPMRPGELPLARATRGETVDGEEFEYLRGDASRGFLRVSATPIRDGSGRVAAGVATFFDITDRRLLEEGRARLLEQEHAARAQAEAANRAKDEFLSVLSHELRTPLTAILAWTELLARPLLEPATLAQGLDVIRRNAKAQARLTGDLLDVSRIISGKLSLNMHEEELAPIVEETVHNFHRTAENKRIALHVSIDPEAGRIKGDRDRLQQAVGNLIGNAVKFTPEGGTVDVELRRAGDEACIVVRDTGRGIDPRFLPYVFERFRQADSSMTRAHGGLGLGLAIVRHIVERHGGSVAAVSEGEGHGATFTVTLPLLPAAERHITHGPDEDALDDAHAASRLSGRRVLVVEDEADARVALSLVLEHEGALVTAVGSAAEAIAAFDDAPPDVLVSDIGMAEEDGYALLRRVRAREPERGGGVPAVAVTAYAGSDDRYRAISAGFQMHLAKPVDSSQLVDAVARLAGVA
jgi:PAS domain S-box-containing protein